jgi:hypothetical protein
VRVSVTERESETALIGERDQDREEIERVERERARERDSSGPEETCIT